jgi:nucleoside-diphosphate-sugar epimerase
MLLVTGITGHTGKYFLQELIDNKYEDIIRCIVRKDSDTTVMDNSGLNMKKVYGDLNDLIFIDTCMKDVDTVMHIYNIHHSVNMVQAAIKNKVKRVILVHTTGIYSNFKDASKEYKGIENRLEQIKKEDTSNINITILRPTMIYGDLCDRNMSKFIKLIDRFRIMPVIDYGSSLIQPVNARDLGKAFYKVLTSPNETEGKTYDLSGEKPIKLIEVFKLISDRLSKKTIFLNIPSGLGVLMARVLKALTLGRIDYIERVQRMGENRSYSHENATRDFGYTPMAFADGIQIEVEEYLRARK